MDRINNLITINKSKELVGRCIVKVSFFLKNTIKIMNE